MTATPSHGSTAVFVWNSHDLTSYLQDDYSAVSENDTPDTTVYGATAETHMTSPIQKGQEIVVGGLWDPTVHAFFTTIGQSGTAAMSPKGTATGTPLWSGTAKLEKYEVIMSKDKPDMFKATLKSNGLFAWSTNP